MTTSPEPGAYYNIGGKKSLKVGEILKDLINLSTTKTIKFKTDKERLRPIDADLQIPNVTKFIKKTGWSPSISYENTLEDLLNYWRKRVEKEGNTFLER